MRTIRNVQVRTARPHQCPGCLRDFEQGAQMEAVTMVEDTPRIIITIHLCAVCRRWLACQRILEELNLNYGDAWTEGGSRGNLRLEPDWAAFREQIEGGH